MITYQQHTLADAEKRLAKMRNEANLARRDRDAIVEKINAGTTRTASQWSSLNSQLDTAQHNLDNALANYRQAVKVLQSSLDRGV